MEDYNNNIGKKKIIGLLGLLVLLVLVNVLVDQIKKPKSVTNRATGTGAVNLVVNAPVQTDRNSTFSVQLRLSATSGSISSAQAYVGQDARLVITGIKCLAPFTDMVWEEKGEVAGSGVITGTVMCVAKTPQLFTGTTSTLSFAQIDYRVKADAMDGEATIGINYGVAEAARDLEVVDLASAGVTKVVKIGTGALSPTPTTDPNGTDLRADDIRSQPTGASGVNCRTFWLPVTNIGSRPITGVMVKLYLDPTDRPPIATTSTPYTFIYSGTLQQGQTTSFEKEICGLNPTVSHTIYSWADPEGVTREPNENNNVAVVVIPPSSGVTPTLTPTPPRTPCTGRCQMTSRERPTCASFGAVELSGDCSDPDEKCCSVSVTPTATPTQPRGNGLIEGFVFKDGNGNCTRQSSSEVGVGGVTVRLNTGTSVVTLGGSQVGVVGYYAFTNVAPGNYTIIVSAPSGFGSTCGLSFPITVTAGEISNRNFGLVLRPTATPTGGGVCPLGSKGDLNCDGIIGFTDLSIMKDAWTKNNAPVPTIKPNHYLADITGDGKVSEYDISILLTNWSERI